MSQQRRSANTPIRGKDGIVRCQEHGRPVATFTSNTQANPGREFHKCGMPQGDQCKAWAWADSVSGGSLTPAVEGGFSTPSSKRSVGFSQFSSSSPSQAAAAAATARASSSKPSPWDAPSFTLPTPPVTVKKRRSPSPDYWSDVDDDLAVEPPGSPHDQGERSEEDEIASDDGGPTDQSQSDATVHKFSFKDKLDRASSPASKKRKLAPDDENPFNASPPSASSLSQTLRSSPPSPPVTPSKPPVAAAAPAALLSRDARLLVAANKSLLVKKARIAELEEEVDELRRDRNMRAREMLALRRKLELLQREALLK